MSKTERLIAGAEPTGLGVAHAMQDKGAKDFYIMDRKDTISSFQHWSNLSTE